MVTSFRLRASPAACWAAALAVVTLAGACAPESEGGYEKVTGRDREYPYHYAQSESPAPASPSPPPLSEAPAVASAGGDLDLSKITLPAGVTAAMVTEGNQLYGTVCVACHGANGAGSPVCPTLNDNEWLHISGEYAEITNIIRAGVPRPKQYPGPMPAMGGGNFNDQQLRALSAYVYALSRKS